MEKKVQSDLIKYLKKKGCYVIKTKPGLGTPVGCPDIFAFYEGWWGAFEVKATEKSEFQPLQEYTINKLSKWSSAWVVHSGNYQNIISELEAIL